MLFIKAFECRCLLVWLIPQPVSWESQESQSSWSMILRSEHSGRVNNVRLPFHCRNKWKHPHVHCLHCYLRCWITTSGINTYYSESCGNCSLQCLQWGHSTLRCRLTVTQEPIYSAQPDQGRGKWVWQQVKGLQQLLIRLVQGTHGSCSFPCCMSARQH